MVADLRTGTGPDARLFFLCEVNGNQGPTRKASFQLNGLASGSGSGVVDPGKFDAETLAPQLLRDYHHVMQDAAFNKRP